MTPGQQQQQQRRSHHRTSIIIMLLSTIFLHKSSDVHSYVPVYFPPQNNDKVVGDETQMTFVEACQLAAENHRPLHLSQDITDLSETIVLRRRQHLSIVGKVPSSGEKSGENTQDTILSSSRRIKIAGKVHSLFLLNNQSQLKLRDLELVHQDDDGEDCRNLGAAVNLRYKSKAWLEKCSITSHAGFCCWAVQKASMDLDRCYLEAPLRSAVVCFGQARFEDRCSTIANAGVHGVCARGECHIRMAGSSIVDAAVRGLYAYANASVFLDGCTIRGTARPDMAAVEVSSAEVATTEILSTNGENQNSGKTKVKTHKKNVVIQKSSSLIMNGCRVTDNAGVGVRMRGGVRHNLLTNNDNPNHFATNLGGNEVDFRSTTAEEAVTQKLNGNQRDKTDEKRDEKQYSNGRHSQTIGSDRNDSHDVNIQRDASGSSFRKGDWWCKGCVPKIIVHGSKNSCPGCKFEKIDGTFLSSEEIIRLNRSGNWMAPMEAKNMDISPATNRFQSENANDSHDVVASPPEVSPTWWFDGDDTGWLPYDTESSQTLERVFQSLLCLKETSSGAAREKELNQETCKQISTTKIVLLSEGRYSVDLETMEQINTSSHFLRLVQRREN